MCSQTPDKSAPPAPATVENATPGARARNVAAQQAAARLAFAAAMVGLALWVFAAYLPALGWAGVIAIATWPFYKRVRARLGAAAIARALPAVFALLIGLVVLAPVIGAGWLASHEAQSALRWLDQAHANGVPPPDGLDKLAYVGPSIAAWWSQNLADPQSAATLVKGIDKGPLIAC